MNWGLKGESINIIAIYIIYGLLHNFSIELNENAAVNIAYKISIIRAWMFLHGDCTWFIGYIVKQHSEMYGVYLWSISSKAYKCIYIIEFLSNIRSEYPININPT